MRSLQGMFKILFLAGCFYCAESQFAFADFPRVFIQQYIEIPDSMIEIQIGIVNPSNLPIMGYSIRLGYETMLFSNPVAETEDTLSQSYEDFYQTPVGQRPLDGVGDFSTGVRFQSGIGPETSGTLIKIRFNVSPAFTCNTSTIEFVGTAGDSPKTNLFDAGYHIIPAVFENGTIFRPGDIDGDLNIDLADSISGLKMLCGGSATDLRLSTDIDCNERIGMENIIYILQTISYMRN